MLPNNVPTKKKLPFKINKSLRAYLEKYNRESQMSVKYDDLLRYDTSIPLRDSRGQDTLWRTVFYNEYEREELYDKLSYTYALLKTDGDISPLDHLRVARIDFCTFGNTQPFRVRIINNFNDNYDHFYVKRADASRIYGLELEHVLSPNRITYLSHEDTLIEEHIAGIPGHDFIEKHLSTDPFNQIRITKEFIKFNERCFIRLLGDMRSYNYVVDITPDIEGSQYRIRAIDFDQQSYEGAIRFYLPQYFKENNPIIFAGFKLHTHETVKQYQLEERSMTATRIKASGRRLLNLFKVMVKDQISTPAKVDTLRQALATHHKNSVFLSCKNMGDLVMMHLKLILQKEFTDAVDFDPNEV